MEHDADVVAIGAGTSPRGEEIPAIVLAVREEGIPIFVTHGQAQSIALALKGEPFERPLTHDLLVDVLTEFGGAIDRVRIDDISDGTFYAKIDVERYDDGESERFVFDARPSDALALAVRVDCPIVVTEDVIDEAGRPPAALGFDIDEESDRDDSAFGDDKPFSRSVEFDDEEFSDDPFDEG